MRSAALAYLLTWTTYGTCFHGDARGTVDRRNNCYGAPKVDPNQRRVAFESLEVRGRIVLLGWPERESIRHTIERHAIHRAWHIHALAVRSNHIHVVIRNPGVSPERVMSEFKAWSTRAIRALNATGANARIWTRHGSTRHLFKSDDVIAAAHYVAESQDDTGRFEREAKVLAHFASLPKERAAELDGRLI